MNALEQKQQYSSICINGYRWTGFFAGYHQFSKRTEAGYACIKLNTGDMSNGNLEFMLTHEISR